MDRIEKGIIRGAEFFPVDLKYGVYLVGPDEPVSGYVEFPAPQLRDVLGRGEPRPALVQGLRPFQPHHRGRHLVRDRLHERNVVVAEGLTRFSAEGERAKHLSALAHDRVQA